MEKVSKDECPLRQIEDISQLKISILFGILDIKIILQLRIAATVPRRPSRTLPFTVLHRECPVVTNLARNINSTEYNYKRIYEVNSSNHNWISGY